MCDTAASSLTSKPPLVVPKSDNYADVFNSSPGAVAASSGAVAASPGAVAAPSGAVAAPSDAVAAPSCAVAAPSDAVVTPSCVVAAPSAPCDAAAAPSKSPRLVSLLRTGTSASPLRLEGHTCNSSHYTST